MSDLFACPHCGAEYPRRPVLVGKVARCTKCRNPFRLRADGVADPVVDPPTSAVAKPKPDAEAAKPAARTGTQTITVKPSVKATVRVVKGGADAEKTEKTEKIPKAEPPGKPAPPKLSTGWSSLEGLTDKPAPAAPMSAPMNAAGTAPDGAAATAPEAAKPASESTKLSRRDFTAKQEEARRQMSAKLSSAMVNLPGAATASPPAAAERIDPLAPLSPPPKKGASSRQMSASSKSTPIAVLSGEGEREGRQQRLLMLICAVVVVLAIAAWLVLTHEGPLDQVLTRFATAAPDAVFPERTLIIQRRCLLWSTVAGGQPSDAFEGLRDRHFGVPKTIAKEAIGPALGSIAGMTLIDHQKVWVDQAHAQAATTLLAGPNNPDSDQIAAALGRAGCRYMLEGAFLEKLTSAGIDEEGQTVLLALLAGETERGFTGAPGPNTIGARLLSGDIPQKIEWLLFTGDHGDFLRYDGFHYKYQDRKYRGHLVRFIGASQDWPTEQNTWRVMDVNVTGP